MDKIAAQAPCHTIGILPLEGFALMSYASTVEPLRAANILGDRPLYRTVNFGLDTSPIPSSGAASITPDATIHDAVKAMENHIAEPMTLGDLADAAGISPRQPNRLFRARPGRSTMRYYREIGLDKARNLLRNSPLPLTGIALATGFSNSSHFSRLFSQHFGGPPSSNR